MRLTSRTCAQAAAERLGYTAAGWPSCSRDWPDWDDLPEKEQSAAATLGLDEYSWPPEADDWDPEDLYASAEMDEEEGGIDNEKIIEMYRKVRPAASTRILSCGTDMLDLGR